MWDVTVADSLAPSYIPLTSVAAGEAAVRAASLKVRKYSNLSSSYLFTPLAFESLGPPDPDCADFLKALGTRTSAITGDKREPSYLWQRLSMAIQRHNAAGILTHLGSCLPSPSQDIVTSGAAVAAAVVVRGVAEVVTDAAGAKKIVTAGAEAMGTDGTGVETAGVMETGGFR